MALVCYPLLHKQGMVNVHNMSSEGGVTLSTYITPHMQRPIIFALVESNQVVSAFLSFPYIDRNGLSFTRVDLQPPFQQQIQMLQQHNQIPVIAIPGCYQPVQ